MTTCDVMFVQFLLYLKIYSKQMVDMREMIIADRNE